MTTDELIAITAGILDRLMLLRDITSRPDCNTCKQMLHKKCPKVGQSVVYGCPLYEEKDCLKNYEKERILGALHYKDENGKVR